MLGPMTSHTVALAPRNLTKQNTATLLEDTTHQVSVLGVPVTSWVPIELCTKALEDFIWRTAPATWSPSDARLASIEQRIAERVSIHTPVLFSRNDDASSVEFVNGRHTLMTLKFLGARSVIAMVPEGQVALMVSLFPA